MGLGTRLTIVCGSVNTEKMGQGGSKQRKSGPVKKLSEKLPESRNGIQSQDQPKQSEEISASTDHPDMAVSQ